MEKPSPYRNIGHVFTTLGIGTLSMVAIHGMVQQHRGRWTKLAKVSDLGIALLGTVTGTFGVYAHVRASNDNQTLLVRDFSEVRQPLRWMLLMSQKFS